MAAPASISFEKPTKNATTGEYIAFASGPACSFQLPKAFITLDDSTGSGTITFAPGKRATFMTDAIRKIENLAKDQCHSSSAEWFNGRIFSADHIANVFVSPISSNNTNGATLTVSFSQDELAVFDAFKDCIPRTASMMKGSSIVRFRGLAFKGKSIRPLFDLLQIKLGFEPPQESKKPHSFLLEGGDEENEVASRPNTHHSRPVEDEAFESILERS